MNPLNWALWSISLFNAIAFIWLGMTVLLNAERRTLATWVAGGGLVAAGLFFSGHSTLVGQDPSALRDGAGAWWRVVWLLLVGPPFGWYLVMVWYNGLQSSRGHRVGVVALAALGWLLAALSFTSLLLPSYDWVVNPTSSPPPSLAGPLLYVAYSISCIFMALVTLFRPGLSSRFMGDLGRRRARPWLVAGSVVLLATAVAVGAVTRWLMVGVAEARIDPFARPAFDTLLGWDLVVSGLLALLVVFLGRAIVSYEIFTGTVLPRGGLRSYWRRGLILAAGYGALIGGSLALPLDPVYRILLATLLLVLFYSLLTWRSYADREQNMKGLRPFVSSQRLYDQLLTPSSDQEGDHSSPFHALCEGVLGSRVAYLIAQGPLAPLAGPPLAHPAGTAVPQGVNPAGLAAAAGGDLCLPLDPSRWGGAIWAVPLWGERGLTGLLLLGGKADGGLYVREEIEIARAVCERIIDSRASLEIARKLMGLQRQRMAESQILDHGTRRTLHDDVLPSLHTALLMLSRLESGSPGAAEQIEEALTDAHRGIARLLQNAPPARAPQVAGLGLVGALRQIIEVEMRDAFEEVTWRIDPVAEAQVAAVPPLVAEVVYSAAREAIRNAARHAGDPESPLPPKLSLILERRDMLAVIVEDDGVGLNAARRSGSGGGQGLALYSTLMAVIGGSLVAEQSAGAGTRVILSLPS